MKRTIASLFAFLSMFAAVAADQEFIRLDITSQPSSATVAIDGEVRGVTPLTLLDVKPGKCLVTVSAPGYRTYDEFVVLQKGAYTQKNYELRPEKGLLLVRTDPAGCDVSYNGLSLGVTPLLITSFAAGNSYQLTLSQNGYGKKTVNVTLDGRRPKILDEALTLDSGIIDIVSDPVGAEVIVNGVSKGKAPVRVERVPRGIATVTLKMDGYEDLNREVKITAGDKQNLSVRLKGRPTRLTVVTIPERARVYVDDQFQGRSPVRVSLEGGSHRVRAELPGYAPMSRNVNIPNGGTVTEEFRLKSVFGRLEITTTPVGAEIWVDRKKRGITKGAKDGAQTSLPFAVEELVEGEHQVTVKMKGYEEASKHFEVSPSKTSELRVKMKRIFCPDIEITTVNGTVKRGQLLEQTALGSYRIETRPGLEEVIDSEDVKSVKPID